jgi:hypothetical protein
MVALEMVSVDVNPRPISTDLNLKLDELVTFSQVNCAGLVLLCDVIVTAEAGRRLLISTLYFPDAKAIVSPPTALAIAVASCVFVETL